MTVTLLGTAAAGSALVLSSTLTGTALAGNVDKATGGGQILVGTGGGAGDTIAFTAQGTATEAKGQVQYVDREDGRNVSVQHGTVDCIVVEGNIARIAGTWRDETPFGLYVVDNGEGSAADDDTVTIAPEVDNCNEDNDYGALTALAHVNTQVTDGDAQ